MFHKHFNLKKHICLSLAILCSIAFHTAQGQLPGLKNYGIKDGLPSSEVYNCMQDSKGFIWFTTDRGVTKFDGYTFKNYSTADGLADNTIFGCQEDYKGRIWFRSFSGKLSYYAHDSIYKLKVNDTLSKIIKMAYITSMYVDSSDNIYLATYALQGGIIKVNLKTNKVVFDSIPNDRHYIICTPGSNSLTGETYSSEHTGLDTTKTHTFYYTLYQINKDGTISKRKLFYGLFFAISKIHDQTLSLGKGIFAASISRHLILLDTVLNTYKVIRSFKDESILNMSTKKGGGIWLSTEKHLLYLQDTALITLNLPASLIKKRITSVIEDKEGGVWFSTLSGGVYYTSSLSFKNYNGDNGLDEGKTTAFDVSKDGTIWAATENSDKISIIHKDSIRYESLNINDKNVITSIQIDSLNNQWIGRFNGLDLLNSKTTISLHLSSLGGIYNLVFNSDGTCWANEYSRLIMISTKGNLISSKVLANCVTKIFNICKDSDGFIWIGTLKGLFEYRHDSLINFGDKYPVLKNRINDIKFSANGNLWMATRDTGLLIKQSNTILHITSANGLISNFCQCLCVDYKGNIWVGTNKGISHIILNKKNPSHLIDTIINVSASGLLEVNVLKSRGDTIYAATSNGLTIFDMNKVFSNKVPPAIYITGIKINSQSKSITPVYNLKYDENYIIINFVGLTYKDAGNTLYKYKMEGIDTGWIYTKNRDVQYPKLASGNYTFLVSAMNNDGVWNPNPASITFNISPPFWATWWARTTFVLLIAGFIYWRFSIVQKRAGKEAEVNKQLISMELKELKAQMDPHFLFNNLNTLTQLVEVKSDDAPEFVEELSKYYRYSLQFRNTEFTTLENELKQAERYLHILKIRFGNNINVNWNIDDAFKTHYIATYSMQLLLENITKHNIVSASKPIWVDITTAQTGFLSVKNQYQPKNSTALSNKHGLKSIDQRYHLLTSKKITILQTSEFFLVQLPLVNPTDYESIYS